MAEIILAGMALAWLWIFWRQKHGSRHVVGSSFVEADDVDPVKLAEIEARTADQLAGTRAMFTPPAGPPKYDADGVDRRVFSVSGAVRAGRLADGFITTDKIQIAPGPDPTVDRHQAFPGPKPFAVTDEELCAQNGHDLPVPGDYRCRRCGLLVPVMGD